MKLRKYHGLGNDYLVLESGILSPETVRLVCDRHRGLGSDGILEPVAGKGAEYGLRIWNPDGTEAEKSGNGLRIYARWLVEHRYAPTAFSVSLSCGVVECVVEDDMVTVQMGVASFEPADIPATEALLHSPRPVLDTTLPLTAVGVGNPHCVIFLDDDLDTLPWRSWGEALETSAWFPNRTNVQFVRVLDRHTVDVRVWERGAGETQASGSSSCAVAAAAVRLGHCEGTIAVQMPGGILQVTVEENGALVLRGPVTHVGEMQWLPCVRD